jgi:hypothetical protein
MKMLCRDHAGYYAESLCVWVLHEKKEKKIDVYLRYVFAAEYA